MFVVCRAGALQPDPEEGPDIDPGALGAEGSREVPVCAVEQSEGVCWGGWGGLGADWRISYWNYVDHGCNS